MYGIVLNIQLNNEFAFDVKVNTDACPNKPLITNIYWNRMQNTERLYFLFLWQLKTFEWVFFFACSKPMFFHVLCQARCILFFSVLEWSPAKEKFDVLFRHQVSIQSGLSKGPIIMHFSWRPARGEKQCKKFDKRLLKNHSSQAYTHTHTHSLCEQTASTLDFDLLKHFKRVIKIIFSLLHFMLVMYSCIWCARALSGR